MTSVSVSATEYLTGVHPQDSMAVARHHPFTVSSSLTALSVLLSLVICLIAPADVGALGILMLGPLHIAQELRRVIHCEPRLLSIRWAGPTIAAAAICAFNRLLGVPIYVEIAIVALLSVFVIARLLAQQVHASHIISGLLLAALVILSWRTSLWWFVVLSNLHNLLPLGVALRSLKRWRGFSLMCTYLSLLTLIAVGTFDSVLTRGFNNPLTSFGNQFVMSAAARLVTPPGLAGVWPMRWLALFLVAQLVHYALWCGLLQRAHQPGSPDVAEDSFRPFLIGAAALSVGLLALAVSMPGASRYLYTSVAIFHVVVEIPTIPALLRRTSKT
jgi:hypothetical protein